MVAHDPAGNGPDVVVNATAAQWPHLPPVSFPLGPDGLHTVSFYSVSYVNHVEAAHHLSVQVSHDQGLIAAGANSSAALQSPACKAYAWGFNHDGELGDGSQLDHVVPVATAGGQSFSQIAMGDQFTLGLTHDGHVYAWGSNAHGHFGDGTITDHHAPALIPGLSGVAGVAAGRAHALALLDDGSVLAWGANASGQLGDGTQTERHTPVSVLLPGGEGGGAAVAASGDYSLLLTGMRNVYAWGANGAGQLGDGTNSLHLTPQPISLAPGMAVAVAAGFNHALLLDASRQVGPLTGVLGLAAGGSHALALRSDGTAWGWGLNFNGQLGDRTYFQRSPAVPGAIAGLQPLLPTSFQSWLVPHGAGNLSLPLAGGISISFGGNPTAQDWYISFATQDSAANLPGSLRFAGHAFSISATDGSNRAWRTEAWRRSG